MMSRALQAAWRSGLAKRPPLHPGAIVDAAVRRAGAAPDEGPWEGRLAILCDALRGEADLNSFGRTVAYGQLVKLVAARARADRWYRRFPQIAEMVLAAPVLIVGQMRSGTTRIHRLLACDPGFEVNRLYDQLDPVPHGSGSDFRPLSASFASIFFGLVDPALRATHPTDARAAEEDFGLQACSFWGAQFEGQWRVPSFVSHVEGADASDAYAEYRRLLCLHAFARGGEHARPWLLKAPQFAQDLEVLIGTFPDARLVVLRREPEKIVASSASLVWHHARLMSDSVTREEIGREWLRKTRLRDQRMADGLARWPNVPRVELDYADVSRDWRNAVREIYSLLDRKLDPAVERSMERYLARSTAHHRHRYSAADFGLTRRKIEAVFA